jgi:hypothetical protein
MVMMCHMIVFPFFASSAFAQPFAWTLNINFFAEGTSLRIVNMATSGTVWMLPIPASIGVSEGVMTPDGRFYLLGTSVGVARFHVPTREFLGMLGPQSSVSAMRMSPSGESVHAIYAADNSYAVINVDTGSVVSHRCCEFLTVLFSADGSKRYEIRSAAPADSVRVAAMAVATETVAWEQTLAGRFRGAAAASNDAIVVGIASSSADEIVVLNASNGTVRGTSTIGVLVDVVCCDEGDFLVSAIASYTDSAPEANRLLTLNPVSLDLTVLIERPRINVLGVAGRIGLTSSGGIAYWLSSISLKSFATSTSYDTVHLPTGRSLGYRGLGSTLVRDIDVEPTPPCIIEAPSVVDAAAVGGLIDVAAVTQGVCLPWFAESMSPSLRILNRGPHSSTTTLRMVLPPSDGLNREFFFTVAGLTGRVVQAVSAPSTPEVSAQVLARRVSLRWLPTVGATPSQFKVRGAQRGDPLTVLATLPSDVRYWTSPDLPDGTYEVDVVARNAAGESAPSERLQVRIDETQRPNAPSQLSAEGRDDVVVLEWLPPASGPTPTGYVIEAAPTQSATFVQAAQTTSTTFSAASVPSGSWQVRVRAISAGGVSDPSNPSSLIAAPCSQAPSPPIEFSAMAIGHTVTLRWRRPSVGSAADYTIEAGSTPGAADLAKQRVGGPIDSAELVAPSGVYFARLRSNNACGTSGPSNEVTVFIL